MLRNLRSILVQNICDPVLSETCESDFGPKHATFWKFGHDVLLGKNRFSFCFFVLFVFLGRVLKYTGGPKLQRITVNDISKCSDPRWRLPCFVGVRKILLVRGEIFPVSVAVCLSLYWKVSRFVRVGKIFHIGGRVSLLGLKAASLCQGGKGSPC